MLKFIVQNEFTDELDRLRKIIFPGNSDTQTSIDDFDNISFHGILSNDINDILAYGRFTLNPNGVFSTWANRFDLLPNTKDAIDLGRCLVNPLFRGNGLMEILVLYCLLYAKEHKYNFVNGAVYPNRGMNEMIYSLGFENCGNPLPFYQSNGETKPVQLLSCNIIQHCDQWESRLSNLLKALRFE